MPNLYFYQSHARNQGILRAVLSLEQSKQVVSTLTYSYVGDKFPVLSNHGDASHEFAVLRIENEESNLEWQPGFYRVDTSLMELNEALRLLSL